MAIFLRGRILHLLSPLSLIKIMLAARRTSRSLQSGVKWISLNSRNTRNTVVSRRPKSVCLTFREIWLDPQPRQWFSALTDRGFVAEVPRTVEGQGGLADPDFELGLLRLEGPIRYVGEREAKS